MMVRQGSPQADHPEYQYLNLLKEILENGSDKPLFFTPEILQQYKDKSEEPPYIRSVFGRQVRFDLSKGFPLLTTKKVFTRGITHELLWFLSGSSNIKYLVDNDVHIWDEWAFKNYHLSAKRKEVSEMSQEDFVKKLKNNKTFAKKWGELGPVYGVQWRKWQASDGRKIDQLKWAIDKLKTTSYRKSIVVSAWNPEFSYEMAAKGNSMVIVPCHMFFHFNVKNNEVPAQVIFINHSRAKYLLKFKKKIEILQQIEYRIH